MNSKSSESVILANEKNRSDYFKPNVKLSDTIRKLEALMSPIQEKVNGRFKEPPFDVVIIVGCPRSGTTIASQLLAATGLFAYPTNVLTRFAYAPYIGALIQEMLFNREYHLGNEFQNIRYDAEFESNIGKTVGALGINEFFHFWRRFFPNYDPEYVSSENLPAVNVKQMRSEIASMQDVYRKPFLSKGMMLQFNLSYFARVMPELKIIYVKRQPIFNMQSVYEARRKYYTEDRAWWSVKPKAYSFLKDECFEKQIAGQVYFTNQDISRGINNIKESRVIQVNYEDICASPKRFVESVVQKWHLGTALQFEPASVYLRNEKRISEKTLEKLKTHYEEFELNNGGLSA